KIAEYSVAIAVARLTAIEHLNQAFAQAHGAFPVARVEIQGDAETSLAAHQQAVMVEEQLAKQLQEARHSDKSSRRSSVGAHKSRFYVWLDEKDAEAATCSTGEQKALLLSIILAETRAQSAWRGATPILLLDEVVAHLDSGRREALFSELKMLNAQAFL